MLPKVTKYGIEESISLQRWIHFSHENVYNIDKNKVMVITQASSGLSKFYEHCITMMDKEGDLTAREREPTNYELDEIESEEWDEDYGEPVTRTLH